MPGEPRLRVTSRVVIRDHRSPICRNKTLGILFRSVGLRFPGSADWDHLESPRLDLIETSPTCLSLLVPPLEASRPPYPHHTGNHFRRPVNLLGTLVSALSSSHHVSSTGVPVAHLWFHNNRPWMLVSNRGHLRKRL